MTHEELSAWLETAESQSVGLTRPGEHESQGHKRFAGVWGADWPGFRAVSVGSAACHLRVRRGGGGQRGARGPRMGGLMRAGQLRPGSCPLPGRRREDLFPLQAAVARALQPCCAPRSPPVCPPPPSRAALHTAPPHHRPRLLNSTAYPSAKSAAARSWAS